MLGMANYYAKQKKLPYNKLNKQLQLLFEKYNIDSNKWDVIRKTAMGINRACFSSYIFIYNYFISNNES